MISKFANQKLNYLTIVLVALVFVCYFLLFINFQLNTSLKIFIAFIIAVFCIIFFIQKNLLYTAIDANRVKFNNATNKFQLIYESNILGILISDFNGNIIDANNAFLNIIGYTRQDIEQNTINWKLLTPKEFIDLSEKAILELKERGECTPFEKQYIRKDGSLVWVLLGATKLNDDLGGSAVTYVVDINYRKEADKKAIQLQNLISQKETDFFKILADETPFMVWKSNIKGECEYVNKRWIEFTGLSSENSIGFGFSEAMIIDETQERNFKWIEIVKNREPYEIKFKLYKKTKELRWVIARANPYYIDGDFQGYIGSIVDITDQELAAQAVIDLSNKKDEFLSIASHELKTPLTTVKAFIQLIERGLDKNNATYKYVEKVSNNLLRLERLISDLLDVSKINAGKLTYNESEFDFNELLHETIEAARLTSFKHDIVLKNSENVIFKGDRYRIEQLLYNFVSNAIKYSPDADKIVITATISQNNIIVAIQDFGIGIDEKNLEFIFQRYYRVDNTAMKFEGLGLGLFIASEILKRHNGNMWIESELGKGSTFYFLLPLNLETQLKQPDTDNLTYYKSNYIEIFYDQQNNWLDACWTGFQNFNSVKEGCLIILDLMQKNNCTNVLNDNSKVLGNWSEASDWGANVFFPMMEKAGLKHFAWIYSKSVFSKMAANKSIDIKDSKTTFQFFESKEHAMNWLRNV